MKKERPDVLMGVTRRLRTGCGYLYTTINEDIEVIARLGKGGGCALSQVEAIGRVVTLALQYGVPKSELIEQLKGISCSVPCGEIKSCADAIGKAIEEGGWDDRR